MFLLPKIFAYLEVLKLTGKISNTRHFNFKAKSLLCINLKHQENETKICTK